MKIITILLSFFILSSPSPCFAKNNDQDKWYPFVIGEKLEAGSPANIGKIVLDAPAGKHGFALTNKGHFNFQDGSQISFWGTNLVFDACFPPKEQAEALANRLAFFGFNAVRLHHMDRYFEPEGIFKDTCPECTDPQMKRTQTLSEEQLDRLDYFIYQLKIRGIYINMNLLVSRNFTEADGITAAGRLGKAAKPASLFDPKLIELQKQYARDLLTHYNPYTQLRYCDDPAVALVEITNENSIFMPQSKKLPPYYSNQLKNKKNTEKFYFELEKSYFKNMTDFLKKECSVKIPITGIGGYWYIQDAGAQESCDYIDVHAYWDHPQFPGRKWDENNFRINNTSMLASRKLGIIKGLVFFAPHPKTKPYTVSEWNHCYPNQYAYETPLLMASKAVENGWDGLFQFAFKHHRQPLLTFDTIDYYFDIMNNPQQLILLSLASALYLSNDPVVININAGALFIDSARIKGAIGAIKNKTFRLGPFEITPDQNGAVILYKRPEGFLLVSIAEVKNTESGWGIKTFNWGKAPVLLKKIGLQCQIGAKDSFNIYALDEQGKRKETLKPTQENNKKLFSTLKSLSPWFEIELE